MKQVWRPYLDCSITWPNTQMNIMNSDEIKVLRWDLIDIVNLCNAGLAQDSPNPPSFYINQIMSMAFGYCDKEMRAEVEEFLTEKKYIPPVEIHLAK